MARLELPLSLLVLILTTGLALAQDPGRTIVWEKGTPNCGNPNLEPDSVKCWVTRGNDNQLNVIDGSLRMSMSYSWTRRDVKIIVVIENASDQVIPVDVDKWTLTGYRTLTDLIANSAPVHTSRGKKGPLFRPSVRNMSTVGLPSNAGITRSSSTRQTTTATGQIVNPNTKVINMDAGRVRADSAASRVGGSADKTNQPSKKWTEVQAGSDLSGEITFAAKTDATYVRVSLNVNGTAYVYRLARPTP